MSLLLLLKGKGAGSEPAGPPATRIAVNREFPPATHSVIVRAPDRTILARWAQDEGRTHNVMNGVQASGGIPGGKKELKVTLPRDTKRDWPDLKGFLNIELQQAGRNRIWDGRISKAPRTDGDRIIINGEAVGWAAALEDRKALRLGFINADQSAWHDPSVARRLKIYEEGVRLVASTSLGFSTLDVNAIVAAIINDFTSATAQSESIKEAGESHFDGGIDIGTIYYDYDQLSNNAPSADWSTTMLLGTTDTFTTNIAGTDHQRTNTSLKQQSVSTTTPGYRFARLRDMLSGGTFSGVLNDVISWPNIRVLSLMATQNMALRGVWPEVGYTTEQILRYAVPQFSELEVTPDSVDDDGYIHQHVWPSDPGTLAALVEMLVKVGLYDWLVKDRKIFELHAPGTYGRRWEISQGSSGFEEAGLDAERAWDRIVGSFQDSGGTTRYVGWPGSGADVESESLQITDPEHPAVKAEVTREDILVLDSVSTYSRATEACERWLQEANELPRSGKATLSGFARDDRGVWRPVGQIAEGDLVAFNAGRDKGLRKVVSYDYAGDDLKATLDLDAPSESVKALLERYRGALISLGFIS